MAREQAPNKPAGALNNWVPAPNKRVEEPNSSAAVPRVRHLPERANRPVLTVSSSPLPDWAKASKTIEVIETQAAQQVS
jgi:hypothetical protein